MNSQEIIIYKAKDGKASVALFARDGDVWLNQNQLAELFSTSKPNISQHISNILKEKELQENSVVKNYLTTAADDDFSLLESKGAISNKQMQSLVLSQYEQFDSRRKFYEAQLADQQDEKDLLHLEQEIRKRQQGKRNNNEQT